MISPFDLKNRLLALLVSRKGQFAAANPQLDKLDHSIQCAWRAQQAGEPPDYVVMCLFHDVFGGFHADRHGTLLTTVLDDYLGGRANVACRYHERAMADIRLLGHEIVKYGDHGQLPHYFFAVNYDYPSFDPEYPTPVLAYFYPLIDEVIHD